jgi:hypothetical protein
VKENDVNDRKKGFRGSVKKNDVYNIKKGVRFLRRKMM